MSFLEGCLHLPLLIIGLLNLVDVDGPSKPSPLETVPEKDVDDDFLDGAFSLVIPHIPGPDP